MNTLNIKLMAVVAALSIIIGACSDQHQYDANTMAALQPCMSMGFQPAQCMAAYQQAGRPQSSDTNWLGTVAAFAAGVATRHWWSNSQSYHDYQYHPEYMNRPDYYDRYYNTPQRRAWVTPQVRGIPQTTNSSVPQLVPEKNTTVVIPGQKIQPLFANPTNIAPNQAAPKPVTTPPATAQSFQPIQVAPPATSTQAAPTATQFKPVQVTPPTTPAPAPVAKKPSSSWSLFGGSTSTKSSATPPPVASKPASKPSSSFAPIRVSPPKSSSSSSSSSSRRK